MHDGNIQILLRTDFFLGMHEFVVNFKRLKRLLIVYNFCDTDFRCTSNIRIIYTYLQASGNSV